MMNLIPNVLQEHSAKAENYLATRGVASCVAIIVTFDDSTTIFIEHVSAHQLFKDMPTIKETQGLIERTVRHIFLRVGTKAVIKSVMLVGGMEQGTNTSPSPYAAMEQIIHKLHQQRDSICSITAGVNDEELRAFLGAIVLIRLQLNPEPLVQNDITKFSYELTILVAIDQSRNLEHLMISQASSLYLGPPQIYMMVILHARTGEMITGGKFSPTRGIWSFYPTNKYGASSQLVPHMVESMQRVEPMKKLEEEEIFDEVDGDDDINFDEIEDV